MTAQCLPLPALPVSPRPSKRPAIRRGSLQAKTFAFSLAALFTVIGLPARADGPSTSVADQLETFRQQWDDQAWTSGNRRGAYMRPLDDRGWRVRMRTLQSVVACGSEAVEPLIAALKSDSEPVRILAAQALGYLAPHVPKEPLLSALAQESSAATRLYLVDSLGMRGDARLAVALNDWKAKEENRDVQRHIGYAIERRGAALDPAITNQLVQWDADTMATAQLGQPAPDFHLITPEGKNVRLSDFRSKKAVVLVFIYGDT